MLILLQSCSQTVFKQSNYVDIGAGLKIKTDNFLDLFPEDKEILQLVTYIRDGEKKQVTIFFKKKGSLKVTVTSLMGIELLSLEITNRKIVNLGGVGGMKQEFFSRVIADMLAVHKAKKLLYKDSLGDIVIEQSAKQRVVSSRANKIMTISYEPARGLYSHVRLKNHLLNYSLEIKTLKK